MIKLPIPLPTFKSYKLFLPPPFGRGWGWAFPPPFGRGWGWALGWALLLSSCSTTSHIPDDDQLFVGLTAITYEAYEKNQHFTDTQAELEAALATTPNGALFGSSYYRSPFPIGLWVWNATTDSHGVFKKWLNRTFGKAPVLMSQVNPALRASVARSVLRKNGYLHGNVTYNTVTQKNPRKAKIAYTVHLDSLFRVDSMAYLGFPDAMQHLIDSTAGEAHLYRGAPFTVANLDAERTRLSQLFRNQGYYYYQPALASFLADTVAVPTRAQLRLQLADSLPDSIVTPWTIGRMEMTLRRNERERADTTERTFITINYAGKHLPLRRRVVLSNMSMRPGSLFSNADYQQSLQQLNATNIFSAVDLQLTPATSPGTLDQHLTLTLDKPYDFYVETNFVNRTIGRLGPELKVGLAKRNAFRGGERVDVNLHGAYEWQTSGSGSDMNSYQYGADAAIEFPRTILPWKRRRPRPRSFYATPWTIAKVSSDVVRRPSYYKMHIVTGEWTYRWQPSATSRHEFSPLVAKYQFMNSHTQRFDSLILANPYLLVAMDDYFIPKMRYTYTYASPATSANPIRWETTVEEAGNATALYDLAIQGNDWNKQGKTLFKNVYSQFLRLETDFTKTWQLTPKSRLVGHVNAGAVYSYGNTSDTPFSEAFYAGGANSVRAFAVRSIGPGAFPGMGNQQFSYLMQNGDVKLVANLEWRFPMFGSLQGALFLDAGNVWLLKRPTVDSDGTEEGDFAKLLVDLIYEEADFKLGRLPRQMATGTGLGLRYDLDFLVVRVDWGFGLHLPYDTGHHGYFNISRFRDMHTLHLAIGYPF